MLRKDTLKPSPPTADPAEVARFDRLADEWWKPDGAFKVVHAFNEARVAHLSERLPALMGCDCAAPRSLQGLRVLDAGCGAGLVAEPISRLGADVLGIDAAARNIAIAERHAAANGAPVRYRQALPEDLDADAASFDIVLSLEVVEHVADVGAFLTAIGRLVRPGGVLVVGTINRTAQSYIKAIIGAEYVLGWLPRGTHAWSKFLTPAEVAEGLRPLGFATLETSGVELDLLSWRWRITAGTGVNYLQTLRRSQA